MVEKPLVLCSNQCIHQVWAEFIKSDRHTVFNKVSTQYFAIISQYF